MSQLILLTIFISLVGCSFSKNKPQDPTIYETIKTRNSEVKEQLISLSYNADLKLIESKLNKFTAKDLNLPWGTDENLLQLLVNLGSESHLDIFHKHGLSLYLPIKNGNAAEYLLKRIHDKLNRTGNFSPQVELENKALTYLHNRQTNDYEILKESINRNDFVSAAIAVNSKDISCEFLNEALILGVVSEEVLTPLNRILQFINDVGCKANSIAPGRAVQLYHLEVQRQFQSEFSEPHLLNYLLNNYPNLSLMIPVGPSGSLVHIGALYRISKICTFANEERFKKGQPSCYIDPNRIEKVEGVTEQVFAVSQRYIQYYSPPNQLAEGFDNKADVFLKEIGAKEIEKFDLVIIEDGKLKFSLRTLAVDQSRNEDFTSPIVSIYREMFGQPFDYNPDAPVSK
ncbi:hypothetical protein [Bdellovibrio reynosensis]|uniref:Lipoprotein n=1 Tax=Bdellovibrio reynosensis TaxID=2835041 RepID=A0ABY4C722_9BACT|nr:hypothetical protein [Bdellovibrio reynosensis]UOF00269.1 hypothetical protein MNR06_11210 [Bdellovibrio reynosensis]